MIFLKNRLHFKNFGQNRIKKVIVLCPIKVKEGGAGVKIEKNSLTGSF
jgi:hypothetical protein